jgi:hypothetical protein
MWPMADLSDVGRQPEIDEVPTAARNLRKA